VERSAERNEQVRLVAPICSSDTTEGEFSRIEELPLP
jgi:hypothetical protein